MISFSIPSGEVRETEVGAIELRLVHVHPDGQVAGSQLRLQPRHKLVVSP